jgi:hypothetical protein
MTIITRGMGAIREALFKKSKKFPGQGSDKQLQKKVDTRIRHGKTVPGVKRKIGADDIEIHGRIGRTQRYRDIKATQLKEARKGKK